MQEITNADVLEFLRLLCNLGNANHLNEQNMTILNKDGQECCVSEGESIKPIQILFNGQVRDENYAILNPFKMVEGNNPALTWFYNTRMAIIGVITKQIIVKIAELGTTKEIEDYDALKLIAKVSEQCDKTMVDEFRKINASDYLRIFYNKKNKTAEAQTLVFTDAIEEQHKFRKKTWHVLAEVVRGLFGLDGEESTLSKYTYRATVLSIPEIDAKLHVMGKLMTVLDPWAKSLLKMDLESELFNKHLANLDTYARMYAWFTAKVSSDKTISTVSNGCPNGAPAQSPAWNNTPAAPVNVPAREEGASIKVDMNPCLPSPMPTSMPTSMPACGAGYGMMPTSMPMGGMPNAYQRPMAMTVTDAAAAMNPYARPAMGFGMGQPQMMPGMSMSVADYRPAMTSTAEENRISLN